MVSISVQYKIQIYIYVDRYDQSTLQIILAERLVAKVCVFLEKNDDS